MRTLWAFFKRDLAIGLSYRFAFLLQVGHVIIGVIFFAFLSRLVGDSSNPYLLPYGSTYLSFVFLGLAFNSFMFNGLTCFGDHLREAQLAGTLEAVMMTPVSLPVLVISSGLWGHFQTTLRALAYITAGVLMGMNLGGANVPGAIMLLLLGVIAFDALGIMGAAVVMLTKQGLPIMGVFSTASALLSGVFFPVELLPGQVQWLAALIPSTYALEGLRLALLRGAALPALWPQLVPLVWFDILLVPLALCLFHLSAQRAMVSGTLVHY